MRYSAFLRAKCPLVSFWRSLFKQLHFPLLVCLRQITLWAPSPSSAVFGCLSVTRLATASLFRWCGISLATCLAGVTAVRLLWTPPPTLSHCKAGPLHWGVCAFRARVLWCGGGVCVWSRGVGKCECLWSSGRINGHGHACQRDQFLGPQEEEMPLLR